MYFKIPLSRRVAAALTLREYYLRSENLTSACLARRRRYRRRRCRRPSARAAAAASCRADLQAQAGMLRPNEITLVCSGCSGYAPGAPGASEYAPGALGMHRVPGAPVQVLRVCSP